MPTSMRSWTSSSTGTSRRRTTNPIGPRRKLRPGLAAIDSRQQRPAIVGDSNDHRDAGLPVPKTEGNPEGKGDHAFLTDWCATEPRGVVAKPERQVLAELFTSMLVLSAAFKYRPVPGGSNYLYWIDGQWSLSLIAPHEWSDERRAGFAGTCVLRRDMTWTIVPSDQLSDDSPVSGAVRRFFEGFAAMLDTDLSLEEILPYY